jgi:hypothetical protein
LTPPPPSTPTSTSGIPARLGESSRGSGAVESGGAEADIIDRHRALEEVGGGEWCILGGHAQPTEEGDPTSEEWSSANWRRRGSSGHRRSRGGSHTHGMPSDVDGRRRKEDRRERRGSRTCGLGHGQGGSEVIIRGRSRGRASVEGSSSTRREERSPCARSLGHSQGNRERIGSR